MGTLDIAYHRGVHLPQCSLWLDAWDAKPLSFVSHAHSDHIAAHEEVILTHESSKLMRARMSGDRRERLLAYDEPLDFAWGRMTLLPAGHIHGSAQCLLETDEGSLLYTGDFKLRHGLSAEPCRWRQADTLIMETTYGLPRYQFPPTDEVLAALTRFCRDTLADGDVPVLLGWSLGKAQEILCALLQDGLSAVLHPSVYKMTAIYRTLRPDFPTGWVPLDGPMPEGHVLICPPSAARTRAVRQIKNRRVAVVTGWALDPGAIHRNQCDAAFPLSDHADYNDLIRYVELVNPRRIRTLHGFAAAFAADLRARGWDAWALSEENQMELFHGTPASLPRASRMTPATEASRSETGCNRADQFSRFADTAAAVAVTSSNVRKVTLIAAYLTTLREHLESLEDVVTWFTGQPFPQRRGRSVQTGWAIIRRALVAAAGITESELRVISARHRDAGRTTLEVLAMRPSQPTSTIGTQVVREWFGRIAAARGPLAKTDLLAAVLRQCTSEEGSFLVRILTGDLRIGLKSGLLEDAVARAFATPLATIREAVMLAGDLGAVARKAAAGEPFDHDVQLFYPIHVMLASPEPTALAVWARMVENASEHHGPSHEIAWAEEKYDGIRAQFHARHGEARLFSRDLNDISAQFPELIHAAARQLLPEHSWILDGEIVADGPGHTFFDLQKRLGRLSAQADFLIGNEVPVRFQAFDLLACNGASQLKTALAQRRFRLESLTLPEGVIMAPKHTIADTAALERAFHTARAAGNEGLVVKLAASLYTPGRRGHAWIKLKQELTTLDVVVVAVEPGHGKRAHLLSDYTFALRCETSGKLRTVGKAYSGLTDDELEELTERFKTLVIEKQSRAFRVKPTVFLEVAFDSVQTSTRHDSGLALRFPRIKRLRDDKTLETIDTVAFARRLVGATTISGDRT